MLGAIVVAVIGGGWAYNWSQTGSVTGVGFTDVAVTNIEQDIRNQLGSRRGVAVLDVQMVRESPRALKGYAKIKVPLLGALTKSCSATMGDDGRSFWQCN